MRQIGKFRSYFYGALKLHFESLALKEGEYHEMQFKLHWANGQLFLQHNEDDHLLITFNKSVAKDTSELEPCYNVLNKYHLNLEQANALIDRAMSAAEEAMASK